MSTELNEVGKGIMLIAWILAFQVEETAGACLQCLRTGETISLLGW